MEGFSIVVFIDLMLKSEKIGDFAVIRLPIPIQQLISLLKKIPGIGTKTAERYAFELLQWEPSALKQLSQNLASLSKEVFPCPICHCLKGTDPCLLCDETKRQTHTLCIVSQAKDVYPLEETGTYKGLYHVLGGVFSPFHGHYAENIDIEKIHARIQKHAIQDIILALDSTMEGDATSLFLKEEMKTWNVRISRLAFGIPLGSSFEYVDSGTLARALLGRQLF